MRAWAATYTQGIPATRCGRATSGAPTENLIPQTMWSSGPMEVNWSVEEFYAVYGDDDKEFVGTLKFQRPVHARAGRPQPAAQVQTQ